MDCLACILCTDTQCEDCYKYLCDIHALARDEPYTSYTDDGSDSTYEIIICQSCMNSRDGWR